MFSNTSKSEVFFDIDMSRCGGFQMAREQKTLDQTLVYLEIIKRIPRRSSVSTQDLLNSLASAVPNS